MVLASGHTPWSRPDLPFLPAALHFPPPSLQPFKLTRAELLQVLNLAPCSEVEVHLIVEECEERLDEQQMAQFLDIVSKHLPRPQPA